MEDKEIRLAQEIEDAYEGWFEARHEGYNKIASQYKRKIKQLEKELTRIKQGGLS